MKNYKQGFAIPLIIAIVALLGIGGGSYVYVNKKSAEKVENYLNEISKNTVATSTSVSKETENSTLAPISVISPNGGEVIPYGTIYMAGDLMFKWKSSEGINYTPSSNFKAYIIDANGLVVRDDLINSISNLGNGIFSSSFIGETKIKINTNYKIKVCDFINTVNVCGLSDGYFKITNSTQGAETLPSKESQIRELSQKILNSLKNKDIETFKTFVHPINGVRFSYDGNVLDHNIKLTTSEITNHVKNNDLLLWAYGSGSGLPIYKTFIGGFNDIYKRDYLNAPQFAYNQILSGGGSNAINSIKNAYPGKTLMSFYFDSNGTYLDENNKEVPQTIAWSAIDLIFDTYNNQEYLIGIVTDNWTI